MTSYKNNDCKKGPLDFYCFCIDMPEDGLSTGQNMLHTCKGNQLN
jgi:hypothetical protein